LVNGSRVHWFSIKRQSRSSMRIQIDPG
jgi:hypothetical protein